MGRVRRGIARYFAPHLDGSSVVDLEGSAVLRARRSAGGGRDRIDGGSRNELGDESERTTRASRRRAPGLQSGVDWPVFEHEPLELHAFPRPFGGRSLLGSG